MPSSPPSISEAGVPTDADPTRRPRGLVTVLRVACFLLGLVLVFSAVWAIASQRDKLTSAWDAARDAHPALITLCLVLPVVNWILTAGTLWLLTTRYGRIPFREMLLLIGSAWLLNMLPLRLGMVGRVAFHKKYHAIRVRDCGKVLLQTLLCSIVALSTLLLFVFVVTQRAPSSTGEAAPAVSWPLILLLVGVAPVVVLAATSAALARRIVRSPAGNPHAWRWPAAILVRYLDMIVWFARYALVFTVIGHPLPPVNAAVVTATAQAAMLTPVQFGLREWTVGATAALLDRAPHQAGSRSSPSPAPAAHAQTLLTDAATGLMADVVMRGAELVIVLPVGLASSWWVWRRVRRSLPASAAPRKPSIGD